MLKSATILSWNRRWIGPPFSWIAIWPATGHELSCDKAGYSFLLILCRSHPENKMIFFGFCASIVSVCHKRDNLTKVYLGNFGPVLHTWQINLYIVRPYQRAGNTHEHCLLWRLEIGNTSLSNELIPVYTTRTSITEVNAAVHSCLLF